MAGFYIPHNAGIGLRCFAWGIVFGLGSLKELLFEGIFLGTVFGHMATTPHALNFYTFVTAHSSFELTAIVLSGAAGLAPGLGTGRHAGAIARFLVAPRGGQLAAGGRRGRRAVCPRRTGRRLHLGIVVALLGPRPPSRS